MTQIYDECTSLPLIHFKSISKATLKRKKNTKKMMFPDKTAYSYISFFITFDDRLILSHVSAYNYIQI